MKKYQITPEHRIELEKIKQKYIDNAFRTDAMTDHDRDQMRVAMRGLYKNANIDYPGDDKIIFVASPLIAQFASGIAMSLIHGDGSNAAAARDAERKAVDEAANAADDLAKNAAIVAIVAAENAAIVAIVAIVAAKNAADATENAAVDAASGAQAAWDAENAAVDAAEKAAVGAAGVAKNAVEEAKDVAENAAAAAGRAARDDARKAARKGATAVLEDATVGAIRAADEVCVNIMRIDAVGMQSTKENATSLDIFLAAFIGVTKKYGANALYSSACAWRYRSRTSYSPWYQVYGDFFKNIAKVPGEWKKWDPLNLDCLHGGVRFMTKDFTIISDRPEILKIDDEKRLHCENGAAVKWRDGMEQYYWHGVCVPDHWIKDRKNISAVEILEHKNAEVRRAGMEIIGYEKLLDDLDAQLVQAHEDPQIGQLYESNHPALNGKTRFLRAQCGTGRWFALPVDNKYNTALEANAFLGGYTGKGDPMRFIPMIRT